MSLRPPKRNFKDYILPFFIVVALGVVIILSFQIWGIWDQDLPTSIPEQSATMEVADVLGEVEIYLAATESWVLLANTQNQIASGEKIRTAKQAEATLKFKDDLTITLAPQTELELLEISSSLNKAAKATVNLIQGKTFIQQNKASQLEFSAQSNFLKITDSKGKFFLISEEAEDQVVVIEEEVTVTVIDNKNAKELQTLIVKADESTTITQKRINLLRIGGTTQLIGKPNSVFLNSSFYQKMLGQDSTPAKEPKNLDDQKNKTPKVDDSATSKQTQTLTAPTVTKPKDKQHYLENGISTIYTEETPITITGTVDSGTEKVQVAYNNGTPYTLQKFKSGETTWTYHASPDYNNLTEGTNFYEVVAINAAGSSPKTAFKIVYTPKEETAASAENAEATTTATEDADTENSAEATTTESESDPTSGVPVVGAATFELVITEPESESVFTEADLPITIKGTATQGTDKISVNNGSYTLQSFVANESTTWQYNIHPDYNNLITEYRPEDNQNEPIEHEYEFEGEDEETGAIFSVTIKIYYQP